MLILLLWIIAHLMSWLYRLVLLCQEVFSRLVLPLFDMLHQIHLPELDLVLFKFLLILCKQQTLPPKQLSLYQPHRLCTAQQEELFLLLYHEIKYRLLSAQQDRDLIILQPHLFPLLLAHLPVRVLFLVLVVRTLEYHRHQVIALLQVLFHHPYNFLHQIHEVLTYQVLLLPLPLHLVLKFLFKVVTVFWLKLSYHVREQCVLLLKRNSI
mmetsp:Transcript_60442/g.91148  ORF Transcript_60442/g.91148 Transcript_60442/m.91148 type:complete len:210 (+) Transcript_60442:1535-2164(+)